MRKPFIFKMQGLEEFSTGWLMTLYFKPCSFATTTHFRCQILYNTFISAYNIYPLLSSHYDTVPYRDITGSHFSIWTIRNNLTIMEVTENHINKLHQTKTTCILNTTFPSVHFQDAFGHSKLYHITVRMRDGNSE